MEYIIKLVGDRSIGWAVTVIAGLIFLGLCYRKVEKYFSEKAIHEKEKNDQFKKVMDQVNMYPKWHDQSIEMRDNLNNSINGLKEKLDEMTRSIDGLKAANSEDIAYTWRYRILRFDDEIRHDEKHTKEHFDQILEDITKYERFCEEHTDFPNNKAVFAIENIKRVYQKCINEGTFL